MTQMVTVMLITVSTKGRFEPVSDDGEDDESDDGFDDEEGGPVYKLHDGTWCESHHNS